MMKYIEGKVFLRKTD